MYEQEIQKLILTYIHMQHMHACSTTEGALHDVNYPEMQEAEEERKKTL